MNLDKYLKYLPDGRVIPRDGRRAWYLKIRRFIIPIPTGVVWLRSKAHKDAMFTGGGE